MNLLTLWKCNNKSLEQYFKILFTYYFTYYYIIALGWLMNVNLICPVLSHFVKEWREEVKKKEKKNDTELEEGQKDRDNEEIKCLRARRVYPFNFSHTFLANEKPAHVNCQLGSLSVIYKCRLKLICIISHISCQPALDNTQRPKRRLNFCCHIWLRWTAITLQSQFPFLKYSSCVLFASMPAWVNMCVCVCVSKCIHPSD